MKGKDINIGEEYAVREWGDTEEPQRARVIAVNDRHRRSWSDKTTRYYTVEFLREDGSRTRRTKNVVARKVIRTWEEHAPLAAQRKAAIAAERQRREESWVAYDAVIARINEIAPELQIAPHYHSDDQRAPLSVSINLRQLAIVCDRLAAHDKATLDKLAKETAR